MTDNAKAICFKLISCLSAACMISIVRFLSDDFSAYQLTFFRTLFALCFFLPWVFRSWPKPIQTKNWKLQIFRITLSLFAMTIYFHAIAQLPLTTATSLTFVTPLFTMIFAVILLKEKSDARKWEGLVLGFIGMLIIIQPTGQGFNSYSLLVIAATICWAGVTICIKSLTKHDSPATISFLAMVISAPMAAPLAITHWQPVAIESIPWLVALGMCAAITQYSFTKAFSLAEVSSLTPFDFSRLVFIGIIAYFAFGEIADKWTLVGATLVIISVLYTTYHVVKKK